MTQNTLITGATGFLGSEIVRQFHNLGFPLTTTGRRAGAPLPNYRPRDLASGRGLDGLLDGIDCVVHSAGLAHEFNAQKQDGSRFFDANVSTAQNVARAAIRADVNHFILISSVSVYGGRGGEVRTEASACTPDGDYAVSKFEAECRLTDLIQNSGMRLTILRLATIYGDGDPGNVARVIKAIDGGRFVWIGKGNNRKTLIHRDDAARAVLLASDRQSQTQIEIFNVAAPPIRMRPFVETLAAALGREIPPFSVPLPMVHLPLRLASLLMPGGARAAGWSATLEKFLRDDAIDARKFGYEFDFVPRVTPEEGLRREVDWYLGKGRKKSAAGKALANV